jgi:NADPH:quinone reductase-like Zn-dependent oxidoreductase
MKAFILDRYGKDERLRLGDVPEPELGDHDLLVTRLIPRSGTVSSS